MVNSEDLLIPCWSHYVHCSHLFYRILSSEKYVKIIRCNERRYVRGSELWSKNFFVAFQRSLVYLLRLVQLALVCVEVTEVVDRVECRSVLSPQCLLVPFQCSL